MFSILKRKKTQNSIYAPVGGKCIDISEVADTAFAKKVMGDGIAVIPDDHKIHAPCDGTLIMLFPTKHAFGMRTKYGDEILVHIGIDTVNLNGEGFQSYHKLGDKIKAGETIISFNKAYLNERELDMTTMVIITNGRDYIKQHMGQKISCGEELLVKKE